MQLIENGIYHLIYLSEAQKYRTGVHSDYDPVIKNNKFYSKKKIFRMSIILDHIAKSPGLMFVHQFLLQWLGISSGAIVISDNDSRSYIHKERHLA